MRGGKLRRQVTIQSRSQAQNAIGEMTDTWSNFATVYAAVEPVEPGGEQIQAEQVNAQHRIMVTMRYIAGITPRMRVAYGSRTFNVQAVTNVEERNEQLVLTCTEQL
jgi:SPP1 family predicted phage head-tail adaptor